LNKCFEKIENPTNGSKKGCLWALNPDKCKKLEEECKRCRQRDPVNIRLSMSRPDDLNKIERGEQRIKKYTAQRKLLAETNSTSSSGNTANTQSSSDSNNNFLLEWTTKATQAAIIKEEVPIEKKDNFRIIKFFWSHKQ
jgi:BRCT domain type II-containing protein